jgi:hypothetical protein
VSAFAFSISQFIESYSIFIHYFDISPFKYFHLSERIPGKQPAILLKMSFNEHINSNLGFTTPARRNPVAYASPSIPTASPLNPYPTPPVSFSPALCSSIAIPSRYAPKEDSALDAAKGGPRSKRYPLRKVVIDQTGNTMLLPIPLIGDLLHPAESGADVNTIFKSSDEARAYPFYPPRHEQFEDDSIPRNETQKRAMVKAMVDALKSTNYAEDNVNMIRPFLKNKYSETRIEMACWKLLVSFLRIRYGTSC